MAFAVFQKITIKRMKVADWLKTVYYFLHDVVPVSLDFVRCLWLIDLKQYITFYMMWYLYHKTFVRWCVNILPGVNFNTISCAFFAYEYQPSIVYKCKSLFPECVLPPGRLFSTIVGFKWQIKKTIEKTWGHNEWTIKLEC